MGGRPGGVMATKSNAKKILLVDDNPVLRKGLVRLIDAKEEFVVCGEASTAAEAMAVIRELGPHLVVVDIGLRGGMGIGPTEKNRSAVPKTDGGGLSVEPETT